MEKEYRDRFSDREAAAVRHIRLIQVGIHAADRRFLPLLDVEVLERRRAAEPGRLRKPGEGGEAGVEKRLAGGARPRSLAGSVRTSRASSRLHSLPPRLPVPL
jgi:hypothetical protein